MNTSDFFREICVRKPATFYTLRFVYKKYVERFSKEPPIETFSEFFWLFWEREKPLPKGFEKMMKLLGEESFALSMKVFKETPPKYNGFDEFIKEMKK